MTTKTKALSKIIKIVLLGKNSIFAENTFSEVFVMMRNYEDMISDIQQESECFKNECQKLKEALNAVIAENDRLKLQANQPDNIAAFKNDFIAVSDSIANNLRQQLYAVNKVRKKELLELSKTNLTFQEKEMYENLWKKTASVLEKEVPMSSMSKVNYSDFQIKFTTTHCR